MPAMTVLLSVCPLGNDGELSNGGTASEVGGRTRPTSALPTEVMVSEPATAMLISTSGVVDRHTKVMVTVMQTVMIVIPIDPPRLVNAVIVALASAVRQPITADKTGRSRLATPSPSSTAS